MQCVGRQYLRYRRPIRLGEMGFPELKVHYDKAYYTEGYWQSMQSLFKSGILGCQRGTYLKLSKETLKTQILWGEQDKVIPQADIAIIDKLLEANPFHQKALHLSNSEHNFLLTQADRICQLVFPRMSGSDNRTSEFIGRYDEFESTTYAV